MGVNCTDVGDAVDDMVRLCEGKRIKVTVIIEELPYDEGEDKDDEEDD